MELSVFIARWLGQEGGAERANYQMFFTEFCTALDLPLPHPKGAGLGDYQFEAPVKSEAAFGKKGTHRIDLYKRGHFILEAKQSQIKPGETLPPEPVSAPVEAVTDLFGHVIGHVDATGKRPPKYDRLMADARVQAERYSLGLPGGIHKSPPFLIVADIGRAFELYFDWTGDGRGYGFFPDQQNYRITLEQLTDPKVQALLRGIWTDPASVDPRARAVEVTRDIAQRLSRVAEALETNHRAQRPGRSDDELARGIEDTSLFLMRVLFCMFAEDVGLLPEKSFQNFLDEARAKSDQWWRSGLADLWSRMNRGDEHDRFWSFGDATVRHFNGNLFSTAQVFDLPAEFKGELFVAARQDWRSVEPAIFGTLLEQVLTTSERAKLGAHYTPRPYVQRLVSVTIGEVLSAEWAAARDAARAHADMGDRAAALGHLRAFHTHLTQLRILDPACGTGNFLYVAMELLLQLESEVIQLATELGDPIAPAVHPNQLLGLELNPRAAVIAELVLWIGWLRHRLANHPDAIGDPVLPTLSNINGGRHGGFDAVLRRTATGEPDTATPGVPDWPEADFIVGNPPFIGGKDIRAQLGGDYAEALWKANPRVPPSADFVMHWWDHAAHILTTPGTRLHRFGFVTTNSITQTFSRRVIEGYLRQSPSPLGVLAQSRPPDGTKSAKTGLGVGAVSLTEPGLGDTPHPIPSPKGEGLAHPSHLTLLYAIPDHPWTRATKDAAAVRIAMTVAGRGDQPGTLVSVTQESGLETDDPLIVTVETPGRINADLTVGSDVTRCGALKANIGICHDGVKLHGKGFSITRQQAEALGLGKREGLESFIRPYRNGRDLTGVPIDGPRDKMVIDLFGLDERTVLRQFPEVAQHLLATVHAARTEQVAKSGTADAKAYLAQWWLMGKPRPEMRPALASLPRYIATVDTAKHRVFQFLGSDILCDDKVVIVASDSAFHFGVLSSAIHLSWAAQTGGLLEDRPVYVKSKVFDPFPFPDATPDQRRVIAELAEELDATRKAALAEVPKLTMTEIYNLRAKLASGEPLSHADQDRARAARAGIVARLHDQIDAAVAAAYGWPHPLPAPEIVARLVALNAERATDEAAGQIRWLRPDYQVPRFGKA
ncbi:MAG: class I SAM-dependent DNA methyltransferase [Sphingomonas sp.]|uniref:DNA methyltransferase n=1 Tax=Sphingomonas sp. TaxID=28214 RepID=UPI0035A8AB50|nr:class I SAM-dependent DNA methyltransferase [Sphingomonas sp.]